MTIPTQRSVDFVRAPSSTRRASSASTQASIRSVLQASGASPFTFCASAISTCQSASSSRSQHEAGPSQIEPKPKPIQVSRRGGWVVAVAAEVRGRRLGLHRRRFRAGRARRPVEFGRMELRRRGLVLSLLARLVVGLSRWRRWWTSLLWLQAGLQRVFRVLAGRRPRSSSAARSAPQSAPSRPPLGLAVVQCPLVWQEGVRRPYQWWLPGL
jgi:hypothetical protein